MVLLAFLRAQVGGERGVEGPFGVGEKAVAFGVVGHALGVFAGLAPASLGSGHGVALSAGEKLERGIFQGFGFEFLEFRRDGGWAEQARDQFASLVFEIEQGAFVADEFVLIEFVGIGGSEGSRQSSQSFVAGRRARRRWA